MDKESRNDNKKNTGGFWARIVSAISCGERNVEDKVIWEREEETGDKEDEGGGKRAKRWRTCRSCCTVQSY